MRSVRACLLLTFMVVLSCTVPPPIDSGGPNGNGIEVATVVANANMPVALTVLEDGRVFYTEKETGQVRVIDTNGQLLEEPFTTVPVNTGGERGLLGITLHPNFAQNSFVYVYYTRSSTGSVSNSAGTVQDNRVVRFTANGHVASGPETLIFTLPALPGPNHMGGNIHFGPDGKLYITIGDLLDSANAQRVDTLAGKILRIHEDGSVPDDNPFGIGNATYALGLRNSFDFAFDPVSGEMFASENGTSRHDELNIIYRGGNYGWPNVEGVADGAAGDPLGELTFTPDFGTLYDPIYDISAGVIVPTGVEFVPDNTLGLGLRNQLVWGEYRTGRIVRFVLDAARTQIVSQGILAQNFTGGITDLAFAPDGTLYVATTTSILHIVPAN